MSGFGRLERVDLRKGWLSEAQHFTPWLASEDNLALLGEALGIDLELEAQERSVGPFRADILCKDTADGSWILIENQLERTDHTHLGQLITYAAGLHAVTIVWIAARFTEEHRAACDWLNEVTGENIRIFGLEVELWRIGESPVAPKFNIVSKPNDWSKSVALAKKSIEEGAPSELRASYLRFWEAFNEELLRSGSHIRPRKPAAQQWTDYAVGKTNVIIRLEISKRENRIKAGLYLQGPAARQWFEILAGDRARIEQDFGGALDWDPLPQSQSARIGLTLTDADPTDEEGWPRQHHWLAQQLQRLDEVFRKRTGQLSEARIQ
ncbi:MAG: DUF4268 domain-containing protein [Paracoccus sp. (in: a-proteobacteria)]|uniref:DUF4268 domain-containing protein n=1 Tax=Paracoccus sp. TaxID=267 RepID=UPI0039E53610